MKKISTPLKLKFEDRGVLRRASLGLLPHVRDPDDEKPMILSDNKSSREFDEKKINNNIASLMDAKGGYRLCRATRRIPLDKKYYWEFIFLNNSPNESHVRLGIATIKADMEAPVGVDEYGYSIRDSGGSYHKAHRLNKENPSPPFTPGSVIGFGFEPGNDSISLEIFINGNKNYTIGGIELTDQWIPAISTYKGASVEARFHRPFVFDPGMDQYSDFSNIPPANDINTIDPYFLINSMKDTLYCFENEKDDFFEAMDYALIPPHQMPI